MTYSNVTKAGQMLNGLETVKENWMHKTDAEKINAIRCAIVDLSNANFNHEIGQEGNVVVLDELNSMLKMYLGWED